jgi:hypothetical protein
MYIVNKTTNRRLNKMNTNYKNFTNTDNNLRKYGTEVNAGYSLNEEQLHKYFKNNLKVSKINGYGKKVKIVKDFLGYAIKDGKFYITENYFNTKEEAELIAKGLNFKI